MHGVGQGSQVTWTVIPAGPGTSSTLLPRSLNFRGSSFSVLSSVTTSVPWFIPSHSFTEHADGAGTVPGAETTAVDRAESSLPPWSFLSSEGRQTETK